MNGYKVGSVYLDLASFKETKSDKRNIYDWDNKITIELKTEGLDFLCYALESVTPLHSKTFSNYILSLSLVNQRRVVTLIRYSDKFKLSYTLSNESCNGLISLLKQARIKIQGWN